MVNTKEQCYEEFLKAYPDYKKTSKIDTLRLKEYSRLDRDGHIYLDYTGGGIYAESQLVSHMDLLKDGVFGNPHSENPTSLAATKMVDEVRAYVAKYFNASPNEYEIIFTSNASTAIKLVAEAYPFNENSKLLMLFDNHNSVNGMRDFAHHHFSRVEYLPIYPPSLRASGDELDVCLEDCDPEAANLFVYPAQSNFSGVQHPLDWIEKAKSKGWHVMLDAAAFVPTNSLDLSIIKPDFVPISFYKMFGYPTGIGALIIRKELLTVLNRPWFAGGTISLASVKGEEHILTDGYAGYEDGTVNYLGFPAVKIGLQHIEDTGIEIIHTRVISLMFWLMGKLSSLKHQNDQALVNIYGNPDDKKRGGTIAINLYDPDGKNICFTTFEKLANRENISIRTGCFCNPGTSEMRFGITEDEIKQLFHNDERNMTFDKFLEIIREEDGKNAGGIRISFGIASNFADAYRIYEFIASFLDKDAAAVKKML